MRRLPLSLPQLQQWAIAQSVPLRWHDPRWAATVQRRCLHVALLAPGLGDALAALPGAGRTGRGGQQRINVPVPDPKLEELARLERTKPVQAVVEVADAEKGLTDELAQVVSEVQTGGEAALAGVELSGKLLATLREAEGMVLAVPAREDLDPVGWLQAAERILIAADLQALEQQVCKGGATGAGAELDVPKFRKALAGAKDKAVQRAADSLSREVVAPGLEALRTLLRAGKPARLARPGLGGTSSSTVPSLDPRFGDLAKGWLSVVTTWQPLLLLADVPESDAAEEVASAGCAGNAASRRLAEHAAGLGLPLQAACLALEGEAVGLRDEPEFLQEYLASFGLRLCDAGEGREGAAAAAAAAPPAPGAAGGLRCWRSQSSGIARLLPRLLNLLTFYTAGEKEARAWMCPRVRKDHSPLPFALLGADDQPPRREAGAGGPSAAARAGGRHQDQEEGVPAFLAARAIHTSFETRAKSVLLWKFADLEALGPSDSGPAAKDRAKSEGKMRRLPAQAPLEEGDVVEFVLA